MASEKYEIGDHIIIKQGEMRVVGKIEEIFQESGKLNIRYNQFYSPEKTSGNIAI